MSGLLSNYALAGKPVIVTADSYAGRFVSNHHDDRYRPRAFFRRHGCRCPRAEFAAGGERGGRFTPQ
jgi:hypothetical protein